MEIMDCISHESSFAPLLRSMPSEAITKSYLCTKHCSCGEVGCACHQLHQFGEAQAVSEVHRQVLHSIIVLLAGVLLVAEPEALGGKMAHRVPFSM